MTTDAELRALPGGEIVVEGLADIAAGRIIESALLVWIARHRLRAAGLTIADPPTGQDSHALLYESLAQRFGDEAHSRYNGLIGRIVSFENAIECVR